MTEKRVMDSCSFTQLDEIEMMHMNVGMKFLGDTFVDQTWRDTFRIEIQESTLFP